MPNNFFRPSENLIQEWPEIFNDIEIDSVPIEYIENIIITFTDGRIWKIEIDPQYCLDNEDINEKLASVLNEYLDEIEDVNFDINVTKLKTDVKSSTKKLL